MHIIAFVQSWSRKLLTPIWSVVILLPLSKIEAVLLMDSTVKITAPAQIILRMVKKYADV